LSTPTKLIVGLGNPGKKYANTRHNIGFAAVDKLAANYQGSFNAHARIPAVIADWKSKGIKWIAMKPITFMNLSGQAVASAINFWNLDISSILVVVDEVEMAPSSIRLRNSGSAGGHNGLKSIIEHLGSKDFARLRIGIGRPPEQAHDDLSDWVLQPFQKTELIWVEESINKAVCAIETWALEGPLEAMNRFNVSAPKNKKDISNPTSA
jgi:PTH1 family peptidyl-tRNA hydrolase